MGVVSDPENNIDMDDSSERKKSEAAKSKVNPEPSWETYLNQPFIKGVVSGVLVAFICAALYVHVVEQEEQVELLKVKIASAKRAQPSTQIAASCASQVASEQDRYNDMQADLSTVIEELQLQLAKSNHTRDKALAKCRLCESSSIAVDKALSVAEADHDREMADMGLKVKLLEKENAALKLANDDLTMDIQAQVDSAVKRASATAIRDAENKRRDLDLELHEENLDMIQKAEKAQRMHAMASRDRDEAVQELQRINDEKEKMLVELGNLKAGHSADFSKLTGELEAISNAVAECQATLTKQDNTLCAMCNHCTNAHFPACSKCFSARAG